MDLEGGELTIGKQHAILNGINRHIKDKVLDKYNNLTISPILLYFYVELYPIICYFR